MDRGLIVDEPADALKVVSNSNREIKRQIARLTYRNLFSTFIEQSPDLIVVCTNEGAILHCNGAVTDALGFSYDEILGEDLIAFIDTPDRLRMKGALTSLANGGSFSNLYTRCVSRGNGDILLCWSAVANAGSVVIGLAKIIEMRDSDKTLSRICSENEPKYCQRVASVG